MFQLAAAVSTTLTPEMAEWPLPFPLPLPRLAPVLPPRLLDPKMDEGVVSEEILRGRFILLVQVCKSAELVALINGDILIFSCVARIIVLSCGDVLLFSGIAWVVTLGLYDVVVFPVMAGEITLVHGGAVVSTAMARPGTTYAATGAPSQRPPDPPMLFDLQIRCRCRCLASVSFDLLDEKERQSPLPPAVPRSKLRSPVRSKRGEKKRCSSSRSLCAIGQPATTPHLRSAGREGRRRSILVAGELRSPFATTPGE
nr:hypothetical protein Iba_scaffold34285CG0010 [Ipomoea batatas]GMD11830.1 hypothetical protein Iba_chr06fCG7440 [Ipomoea batatas]